MDQKCLKIEAKKAKKQQQPTRNARQKAIERPPSEDCLNAIN